jgi:hypothetical protein
MASENQSSNWMSISEEEELRKITGNGAKSSEAIADKSEHQA